MREACGGWALAQCGAKRSTEAKRSPKHADLVGKSPQGHAQKNKIQSLDNCFFVQM
ncbi:MAG: hypothetical protein NZ519_04160 [Bacteroidia bacterium]|nr:hypothetical protein [Bacteroidia bacterium]